MDAFLRRVRMVVAGSDGMAKGKQYHRCSPAAGKTRRTTARRRKTVKRGIMKFSKIRGKEKVDYVYRVYKTVVKQSGDFPPFPAGIERMGFADRRVLLQCQGGGFYQGPTISALIAKIIVAQETVDEETKKPNY